MRGHLAVTAALVALAVGGPLRGETHQDFDNPGSPYLLCTHFPDGAPAEVRRDPPAADFSGSFLRLATVPATNHNSAVFEVEDPGAACRRDLDLEFDLRISPSGTPADGIGVALLRESEYGTAKCVDPEAPYFAAEEPNFRGSLGLGFDVHRGPQDSNDNHVSVHYDGAELSQFDAGPVTLASSDWIHVHVHIRGEGGDSRLTVVLKPKGPAPARAVVDNVLLAGFVVHPWRLWLGARSGGGAALHDVDNVHVVASGCPPLDGRWDPAPVSFGAVAIHAALLPNGRVLFWDRHDYGPLPHPEERRIPYLWDPADPTHLTRTPDPGYDLFCAGHAFRGDGKLFVAGGHVMDGDGEPHASSYDPISNQWEPHPDMNAGRWYPTTTTLADGTLLTASGTFRNAQGNIEANTLPQVFDPNPVPGSWRDLDDARREQPLYPFLFLAPNGKVIDVGPQPVTRSLDPSGAGGWSFVAISHYGHRDYGSAVMPRPGRILIVGGSLPDPFPEPPTNSAEVIDLGPAQPRWRIVPHMAFARRQHTATLLPDGTVLVTGGTSVRGFNNALGAVHAAERWDPEAEAWTTLARLQEARLYHSTSLLLPDARVLVAGGGHPSDPDNGDGDHPSGELFSPPYLFQGPRPVISQAPAAVVYGQSFAVQTRDATSVDSVTLVRLGAVTHGFDQNQRFLELSFDPPVTRTLLTVHAPAGPNLAPPGDYMLFILRDGVPSVAWVVRIAPAAQAPRRGRADRAGDR
jgi:hypothetical protein